ncbi:MAG: hypothetical protein HYV26_18385, partial [Candidatus Hydrogenedentes bacterium]|nr:hypothetical protein [Candidatus Hydrogenedentota bacterium]
MHATTPEVRPMLCARLFFSPFAIVVVLLIATQTVPLARGQEAPPADAAALHVIGTFPLKNELLGERLVLFFDRPIKLTDPAAPLAFTPELPGRVEVGENYLSFHRDTSVPFPREVYAVTIAPSVQGVNGEVLAEAERTLKFVNFRFRLESLDLVNEDGGYLYFELVFEVDVSPQILQQKLVVKDASGAPVQWSLMTTENSKSPRIAVPATAARPVTFELGTDFTEASGKAPLEEPVHLTFPSDGVLVVQGAEWKPRQEGRDRIEVNFSNSVYMPLLQRRLRVVNTATGLELPYTLEGASISATAEIALAEEAPEDATLKLEIAAGVPGKERMVLAEAYSTELKLTQATRTPLDVTYHDWEGRGVDGAVLRLQFNGEVDAESLRKHLHVEPAASGLRVQPSSYNWVEIYGDWKSGTVYTLSIAPALVYGPPTPGEETEARDPLKVVLEEAPKVEGADFGYPGKYYFPRRNSGPLPIQARNLKHVNVTLHQLFPSNIVAAIEHIDNGRTWDTFSEKYAQEIVTKELPVPERPDTLVTVPLEIQDFMPADKKGVFGLTVTPVDDYRSTRIVVWTNIGLLAQWEDDEVVVFAHDLYTLAPLPLAKISVYSAKSQLMGTANTDERGIAHLQALNTKLGTPRVVVAETQDDYTFLDLTARSDDPTGFTESMPHFDSEAYDAFLYSDRNLYRPGETAHLRWVVRTGAGLPVANVPL